jgi:hypothetical protein
VFGNPREKGTTTPWVARFVPIQLTENKWRFPTSQGSECKYLRNDGGEFSVIKIADVRGCDFRCKHSLHHSMHCRYELRGVLNEMISLSFDVQPFAFADIEKLTWITTILSVELRDGDGQIVCTECSNIEHRKASR